MSSSSSRSPSSESRSLPDAPACPFCEETETELMSAFGSHASVSTYWCRRCRSPFELLKWGRRRVGGSAATGPEGAPGADGPAHGGSGDAGS